MQRGSLAYVEGVVDVGVIVPACFINPIRSRAVSFLGDVLAQKVKARIPVSTVLGAYHVATSYLRAPRASVGRALRTMLETYSPAFFSDIPPYLALEAIELAVSFQVESWDGYIVTVARLLNTDVIYSLDKSLERVPGIRVASPFSEEELMEYHNFILSLRRRRH